MVMVRLNIFDNVVNSTPILGHAVCTSIHMYTGRGIGHAQARNHDFQPIKMRDILYRVLLAAEGTFGGENLRGPNIQLIATTLIY
jgi:hypothetical protein